MDFGVIQAVPVKTVWPGEATHFTPWLANNLEALGEKLGVELVLEGMETSAGDFAADIVVRDLSSNRKIIIENQYGRTDHTHLGQILTYASMLDADAVVWIAETIRQEHKTAIDFLNQKLKSDLQFYALEVSVIRIDNSRPAFTFNMVCEPVEAAFNQENAEPSELRQQYRNYFQELIDELRTRHQFTNARVAQAQNWYTFSSENSRLFTYSTSFAQHGRVRTEVYIDCGDKSENEQLFDALFAAKEAIEAGVGSELSWERLDNRRACRIALYRAGDIDAPSETLEEIRRWTIASLLKLKEIFPARILQAHRQLIHQGA